MCLKKFLSTIRVNILIVCLLIFCIPFLSCSSFGGVRHITGINGVIPYDSLGKLDVDYLYINDVIDMNGTICHLPHKICLYFKKGACIKNGVLVGHNNTLHANDAIFDHMSFAGSWNIPIIKTSYFKDLKYDNSLGDVLTLCNPNVMNDVIIENGIYWVSTDCDYNSCLQIKSNTHLIINGVIKMRPNGYESYGILQLNGENIKVSGNGTIIGEKDQHQGKKGEWGMGVNVKKSQNVLISGIQIENCWGDCIYVGGASRNVVIEDCILKKSRRQGISITYGDSIKIRNCNITSIHGTPPGFGIDIEPNKNERCENIFIDSVTISDCEGGIIAYGESKGSFLGKVSITNCCISDIKSPFWFFKCEEVELLDCSYSKIRGELAPIHVEKVKKKKIKNLDSH